MTLYRYKTAPVEARQVPEFDRDHFEELVEIAAWCGGYCSFTIGHVGNDHGLIHVPGSYRQASAGDWIVQDGGSYLVYEDKGFREHYAVEEEVSV